ncbi:MAG: Flp pilus assembly protein CpaB [Bdellovibrionales bacterium]|nr:Flp pilus assembly protein CpaB [Bdellovibrionales bacterium]
MNQNETRTLWLSIGAALFAVFLLYSYTQEKSAELTKQFGARQNVVIAKTDINEMQTIDETMLEITEQPVDFVQPQALNNTDLAVGKVALAPIRKGEQILESKILKPGPLTGLALQIAPNKRAITIPIDDMRGVAKLVKPGDRIDLIAAIDVGRGPKQRREVKTIMQNIVILATGVRISNEVPRLFEKSGNSEYIVKLRDDTSFTNVTVEVTPKQAQDLIYILSTSPGSLFLSLRHPSDNNGPLRLPSSNVYSVLGTTNPDMVRQQTPPPKIIAAPKPKPKKPVSRGGFKSL